jgi:hypothetical protein
MLILHGFRIKLVTTIQLGLHTMLFLTQLNAFLLTLLFALFL